MGARPMRRLVTIQQREPGGVEGGGRGRRAMMILLFEDTINLINLGMPMTNSEAAGPRQEPGCGGLINLTNKRLLPNGRKRSTRAGHYGRQPVRGVSIVHSGVGGGGSGESRGNPEPSEQTNTSGRESLSVARLRKTTEAEAEFASGASGGRAQGAGLSLKMEL